MTPYWYRDAVDFGHMISFITLKFNTRLSIWYWKCPFLICSQRYLVTSPEFHFPCISNTYVKSHVFFMNLDFSPSCPYFSIMPYTLYGNEYSWPPPSICSLKVLWPEHIQTRGASDFFRQKPPQAIVDTLVIKVSTFLCLVSVIWIKIMPVCCSGRSLFFRSLQVAFTLIV